MKRLKKLTVSVTFTLYEDDLSLIASTEPQWDDPKLPDLDTMGKLWSSLAEGAEINGTYFEPDYEAYGQFLDQVAKLWNEIKVSPLEALAEAAE